MKKKNGAGAGRSVWSPQAKNPSGWKRTTQKREVSRIMFAYVRLCSPMFALLEKNCRSADPFISAEKRRYRPPPQSQASFSGGGRLGGGLAGGALLPIPARRTSALLCV